MIGFLDKDTGLPYFWQKLKAKFILKPSSATSGQVLTYDGTNWNASTPTTVNNGTLTIQQNGTTLGTFSANQSGATTINITAGSSDPILPINPSPTPTTAGAIWIET